MSMMTRLVGRRRSRRGANTIEFGLTLPVFLLLTFGVIEFGWYFSRVALTNTAAMDGCRAGSLVDPLDGSPAAEATARIQAVIAGAGLTCVNCSAVVVGAVPNRALECTVEVRYNGLFGIFGNDRAFFNPFGASVRRTNRARLEWQRNN